jgi:hypothetical protein
VRDRERERDRERQRKTEIDRERQSRFSGMTKRVWERKEQQRKWERRFVSLLAKHLKILPFC